jgi:hypothetical protein
MKKTEFMEKVGATMSNTRWSWCGVNEDKKQAYFFVWDDKELRRKVEDKTEFVIREPNGSTNSLGYKEQTSVIERCIQGDLSGNVAIAEYDKSAWESRGESLMTRVKGTFYFQVDVQRNQNSEVVGRNPVRLDLK